MKKSILVLITVVAVIGLIAGTSLATGAANNGNGPTLVVTKPVLQIGQPVTILGSGFEPGETVYLVINAGVAGSVDIEYELEGGVSPVVNDVGAFVTAWIPDRIAARVIAGSRGGPGNGAYTIMATDTDYNTLTTTPIALYEVPKDGSALPAWAQ